MKCADNYAEKCSCTCGCGHILANHERDQEGNWCGACYGEQGHAPTSYYDPT